MFFSLSKLFWLLVQPTSLVLLLVLGGLALVFWRRRRTGLAALAIAAIIQFLVGFTSLGYVIIQPLENRFQVPSTAPETVGTIIVLGGATMARPSTARGIAELNQAGDRLATTLWLARQYPEAKVMLSRGGGFLMGETESEAETMARFLTNLGVAEDRLILEEESRNTAENASLSRAALNEEDGVVVLVTSAFHMPRSVGIFRQQGIEVLAWPTDYRSAGDQGMAIDIANPNQNLETATIAMREWIGLLAYHWTGRTSEFLPAP
ncbi:MAG: YdcF family protein [Devosia sp.]|uniref:YdcF family protein n=1 Tax=Devosia sp. TaxID=1871048 RepID=UPI0024CC24E0|nr:YdcF family protein [Devosia sp.]UYO01145.1 MAG: YdcF family protein [Devosia sp.]